MAGLNPVGDGGATQDGGLHEGGDIPLRVEDILVRFAEASKNSLRQDAKTASEYGGAFRRFARVAGLEGYSRKQLTPTRGHKLLMDFFAQLPEGSRRWNLAAIKKVWVAGLGLPWPIDNDRDFGRTLPPTGRRLCPNDNEVKPFALALEREPNTYIRLFARMMLTYAFRPEDQLGALRWGNFLWTEDGRPHAIVALGVKEGFKTRSPVVAYIPAALAEDLLAWKQEAPDSTPEAPLLPWRSKPGYIRDGRRQSSLQSLETLWADFKERHGIQSKLTMAHMRHWVKRKGRKRLDLAILAYWQGHKPEGGGMAGHYGTNLPVEEVLEEQAREWPDGPLGDLLPPKLTHEPGLPEEAVKALGAYFSGDLDSAEVLEVIRALKRKLPARVKVLLKP